MTTALTTTTGTGIAPADKRTADLTGMLHNLLETIPGNFRRCALSAAYEPNEEQRALLVGRRNALDGALAGCDAAVVRRSVGMLRSVMAAPAVDPETQKLQRQAYLAVLTKFPAWAVERACMQFLDGTSGQGVHAPKPGEIAVVCRQLLAAAQEERAKINAVLDAEIYTLPTDEERAEVARRYEQFVAETARAAKMRDGREVEGQAASVEREAESRALAERLAASEATRKAKVGAEQ